MPLNLDVMGYTSPGRNALDSLRRNEQSNAGQVLARLGGLSKQDGTLRLLHTTSDIKALKFKSAGGFKALMLNRDRLNTTAQVVTDLLREAGLPGKQLDEFIAYAARRAAGGRGVQVREVVRYASMTVDMKALVADETVRGAVVGSGAFGAGYLIQRGDGQTFLKIFHANRRPALAFEKPGAPAQDVPVAAARQPLGAPVAADSDRPLGILSQAEVSSLRDGASVELIPVAANERKSAEEEPAPSLGHGGPRAGAEAVPTDLSQAVSPSLDDEDAVSASDELRMSLYDLSDLRNVRNFSDSDDESDDQSSDDNEESSSRAVGIPGVFGRGSSPDMEDRMVRSMDLSSERSGQPSGLEKQPQRLIFNPLSPEPSDWQSVDSLRGRPPGQVPDQEAADAEAGADGFPVPPPLKRERPAGIQPALGLTKEGLSRSGIGNTTRVKAIPQLITPEHFLISEMKDGVERSFQLSAAQLKLRAKQPGGFDRDATLAVVATLSPRAQGVALEEDHPGGREQVQLTPADLKNVARSGLNLLKSMAAHGYIHGDIKGSNLVLDKDSGILQAIDTDTLQKISKHNNWVDPDQLGAATPLLLHPRAWAPVPAPGGLFSHVETFPTGLGRDLYAFGSTLLLLSTPEGPQREAVLDQLGDVQWNTTGKLVQFLQGKNLPSDSVEHLAAECIIQSIQHEEQLAREDRAGHFERWTADVPLHPLNALARHRALL